MGSSVKAHCECGYEESFLIGGGIMNCDTLCLFPCLCRKCVKIVDANLLQARLACPKCKSRKIVPYDQAELCEQQGSSIVTSWNVKEPIGREVRLTDGRYYCPSCSTYRLQFVEGATIWD